MTEDDIKAYLKGYTELANKCAQYKIGEVVAIAQPYKDIADNNYFLEQCSANEESVSGMKYEKGWNNKVFAAAYYLPHQIRITDIKVERLQDICDEDCIREGVEEDAPYYWVPINYELPNWKELNEKVSDMYANNDGKIYPHFWDSPKKAFSALIDAVCGKGTWELNPYVFAYTFELVK